MYHVMMQTEIRSKSLRRDSSSERSIAFQPLVSNSYERTQTHVDLETLRSAEAQIVSRQPTFASSRRLSRSLPELRDVHLVTTLASLAEEYSESEYSEDGGLSQGGAKLVNHQDSVHQKNPKDTWFKKYEFIFTCFTQALDLETIWRFPFYCYQCGGGSFVIATIVVLIFCGLPMLCTELALGQFTQNGPIRTLRQVCPLMKGLGFSILAITFLLTAFHSVLTTYFVCYFFNSFYSIPTYISCLNSWNTAECIDPSNITHTSQHTVNASISNEQFIYFKLLDMSSDIMHIGELRVDLVLWSLFLWIFVFFSLRKFSLFASLLLFFLAGLSYVMYLGLFFRILLLKGTDLGIRYFFQPKWKDFANAKIWLYAVAQVCHSLGTSVGTSLTLGSRSKHQNNPFRDTILLVIFNVLACLLIGCVCFSTLGFLASITNQPIESVIHKDPMFVFTIYSVLIGTLPLPSVWGVIFFFLCICLGIEYQFRLMGTVVVSIEEAFPKTIKNKFMGHSIFLLSLCICSYLLSMIFFSQAGLYYLIHVDFHVNVFGVVILSLLINITVHWLYGAQKLSNNIQQMTGKKPAWFYLISWKFTTPCFLFVILIFSIIKFIPPFPNNWFASLSGAFLIGIVLIAIPWLFVKSYVFSPKSHPLERLRFSIQPKFKPKEKTHFPILYIRTPIPFAEEPPDNNLYTISEI